MSRLAFPSRGLFGREVVLDVAGIRRGKVVMLWDELDHYRYDWQEWSRPADIVAVHPKGATIRIAPFFDQWSAVAEKFFTEAHPRLRPHHCYAPFSLDGDALVCGTRRLAIAAIAFVEIAAIGHDVAVIIHERNAGEWVEFDIRQIANVWLLIEALVERDVTLRSIALGLPPALSRITTAIARDEGIPTARLV